MNLLEAAGLGVRSRRTMVPSLIRISSASSIGTGLIASGPLA